MKKIILLAAIVSLPAFADKSATPQPPEYGYSGEEYVVYCSDEGIEPKDGCVERPVVKSENGRDGKPDGGRDNRDAQGNPYEDDYSVYSVHGKDDGYDNHPPRQPSIGLDNDFGHPSLGYKDYPASNGKAGNSR